MTTWYTSDLHFGHANIINYCNRPWETTEEMDEGLVYRWNGVVHPSDTVYVLGDVSLSVNKLEPVSRLNGHKILVAGNHDKCWAGPKRGWDKYVPTYIEAGFEKVETMGVIPHHRLSDGRSVNLSHLPYHGDSKHGEDRYNDFRPLDQGEINFCGHVHDVWKVQGKSINVGVDVWDYTPVAEEVLIDAIKVLDL